MAEQMGPDHSPNHPFDGLAEFIVEGLAFRPSSPDNRVAPFALTDEEVAYLRGAGPEPDVSDDQHE